MSSEIASIESAKNRDERGVSVSVLVCGLLPAFILMAGLAVDGAAQLYAERRAETAAAQAARAGSDAAAGDRLVGSNGAAAAIAAVQQRLAGQPDLSFTASLDASGRLHVATSTTVRTQFLSLIGITTLEAQGSAVADLRQA